MIEIHSWLRGEELSRMMTQHKIDARVDQIMLTLAPSIWAVIDALSWKLKLWGRCIYIWAWSSWRLGVLDASEVPPTFGLDESMIGVIAWGDKALRNSIESAEDSTGEAWNTLQNFHISEKDMVIWIAASWRTPYTVAGIRACLENGITTWCISCKPWSILGKLADYPIEINTWEEFILESTRLIAWTAQKDILNQLSTGSMIQLWRTKENKMIYMKPSNDKLLERGIQMILDVHKIPKSSAKSLLKSAWSAWEALKFLKENPDFLEKFS